SCLEQVVLNTFTVSFAMEEGDEMGMEAMAPSVALSGAAEIGVKNVDKDSDGADAKKLHLIRKYQVNFSSQGTTDGGLVFGAGISIEDEHKGDEKQINGSNVYIGGGRWYLEAQVRWQ
ncbi:MAG: porin, partial [Rhodobacteraceae bacterium]|nr:porin [Paracoccaceae bacterium]